VAAAQSLTGVGRMEAQYAPHTFSAVVSCHVILYYYPTADNYILKLLKLLSTKNWIYADYTENLNNWKLLKTTGTSETSKKNTEHYWQYWLQTN